MKYICLLIKYIKKRSLESSETPVLCRGRTVPKGKYTKQDILLGVDFIFFITLSYLDVDCDPEEV